MTDREVLDLVLVKVTTLDDKVTSLEREVSTIKGDVKKLERQVKKSTNDLKKMDKMILDEVDRVHKILDMHKEDKTVHTA